jgi:DNA polymerase-3 subunit alpha
MNFTHLHVHTEYSVLDGFSNVKKLIKRTKELGMSAVAITDHGSMFGTTEFFQTAKAEGVKPIIGLETYIAPRRMFDKDSKIDRKAYHLILLAQDMTGYKNLLKIASASQLEGFYYHPRIDHEFLSAHSEGLIATNACLAGELQQAYLTGGMESAIKVADWYRGVFGDRFYFEIQDHANVPRLDEATKATIELAKRYGGKIIATNDVHYVNKEDAKLQDILLALQTGKTLNDPGRLSMGDDSYYLRSPDEMMQIFNYIPEAITNTIEIADRCNVDLTPEGYQLPQYPVPEGNSQSYLRDLCEKGLREKYGANADDQKVRERFEYELDVIHTMGFDDYFLIVWDICKEATNRNIWYNARGSAAGSIVAFALNITSVEPLGFGLIFERFLNPGRVSMPDIDLDFQDDRRGEMMTYCVEKYGEERVANIVTFGRMKAKAAIRDVGRVLDIPISKVDKIAKLIPESPSATIDKALTEIDELQRLYDNDESVKAILDLAKGMEGAIRSLGTHACGVVVTPDNITNHVALAKHVNPDGFTPIPHVAQTDMFAVDITGLLKVDFLGLATLTIMNNACQLIKERHGVDIGLESIPTDDPATYELLGEGDTTAVFQFESAGMKKYLQSMKPNRLENAIAMVALYRPGPMDFIPHYISRMHGDEKVEYLHEKLEPIFSETYGIPVYQEQIMFAAIDLAGYTASESDDLRKAISKKKADKIAKHRTKFITGCIGNGIEKETAEAIFTEWENFARYGFNKSHAAAYGIMAVKAAYLKKHFPVEFMASVLSVFRDCLYGGLSSAWN